MFFVENSKEATKKKKKDKSRTNKWVQGHRIQDKHTKSFVFLYISDEHVDNKIENTLPFIMVPQI